MRKRSEVGGGQQSLPETFSVPKEMPKPGITKGWIYDSETGEILLCSVCGTGQYQTPSGVTCENYHGGAEGVRKGEFESQMAAIRRKTEEATAKNGIVGKCSYDAVDAAITAGHVNPTTGKPVTRFVSKEDQQAKEVHPLTGKPLVETKPDWLRREEAGAPTVAEEGADEGEEVSVTYGEETYCPVQYHSFHVGPFSGTTRVRAGETRPMALQRLVDDLREIANKEYAVKLAEHLDRVRLSAEETKKRASR